MEVVLHYLIVLGVLAVIFGVFYLIVKRQSKIISDKRKIIESEKKQTRLLEIKELEERLRSSAEHKRRRESALKMLELLVPEHKAKKIIYSIDDKLDRLYYDACNPKNEEDFYNYSLMNSPGIIDEKEILFYHLRWEYFKDNYIENFVTKAHVLGVQKSMQMEVEIKEDRFILKNEHIEDGIELDNHFTRKFLKDMAKSLGYNDLVFPADLDESLKDVLELKDYEERVLPYLKPLGYSPVFFHSDKKDDFYQYTIIPEEKYAIMKKLLEDIGYEVDEPLNGSGIA